MRLLKYLQSNIGSIIFMVFMGFVFFNADARTLLIKGLMSTGLYNADAPEPADNLPRSLPAGMNFRSEDGQLINLSENKGKVFFINFWATWCPPCRAEMPSINALYSKVKNKDKVIFIMVDVDNKIASSVKFMKNRSYQLQVYSSESVIPEQIFNGSLPTTLIIDAEGNIVFHHTGMADYDNPEMINFLNTLSL